MASHRPLIDESESSWQTKRGRMEEGISGFKHDKLGMMRFPACEIDPEDMECGRLLPPD